MYMNRILSILLTILLLCPMAGAEGKLEPISGDELPPGHLTALEAEKQRALSSASLLIDRVAPSGYSDSRSDGPLVVDFSISASRVYVGQKVKLEVDFRCEETPMFITYSGLMVLKVAPLPEDIVKLGVDGVNRIWRDAKVRGVGMKRAKTLVTAAEHSVGSREAQEAARIEFQILLSDLEMQTKREAELMEMIREKIAEVPYVDKLLEIRGVGLKTVVGFVAEVGDIRRFDDPKQLQKLAGYAIVKNQSGKHKGESHISYRGRKRLRYVLYEAAVSVVCHSPEFRSIHQYYTTRDKNPLKKMQSMIAVACKLIRIFYMILQTGATYDAAKMMGDIRRPAAA